MCLPTALLSSIAPRSLQRRAFHDSLFARARPYGRSRVACEKRDACGFAALGCASNDFRSG
eukprot:1465397-Lingulodinium_polyedra.AAC.1